MNIEERNAYIMKLSEEGKTHVDIAKRVGISRPRVTQIINKLKKEKNSSPSWEDYKTAADCKGIEKIDWWDVVLLSAVAVAVVIIISKFIVW